jgi:hypothetical protein
VKSVVTVRYVSGREEKFEVDLWGGASAQTRLKEFAESPSLILQTATELVIIPVYAIECISIALPKEEKNKLVLGDVRTAKRLT